MKSKNYIYLAAVFLLSCSGGNELESKKQKLNELKAQQRTLQEEIKKLESEVATLSPKQENNIRVKSVQTAPVATQPFKHFIAVQGTVDSDENIDLSPKMGGVYTRVLVNEGDRVNKGQVLAVIDDAVMQQSVEELKTGLELASTIYEKQRNLWEQKIGSEVQYLQAKNNKESLERKLQTLNSQLAQTRITSPISGVVDKVSIKPGEAAVPGMGVIRVVNLGDMKITARVADSYIGSIKKGDAVSVKIPDLNKEISGKISYVEQVVHPSSRTFGIEVRLANSNNELKPNMLAVVNINDETKEEAVVINKNYVQRSEVGDIVFVASNENGRKVAKAKKIKTGLSYSGEVEIVEGLQPGEQLITSGYQDLVDGQPIAN